MALAKRNVRVTQLNFEYDEDSGDLQRVAAHVCCDIFDGATKLTTHAETVVVEVAPPEQRVLVALLKRLTA